MWLKSRYRMKLHKTTIKISRLAGACCAQQRHDISRRFAEATSWTGHRTTQKWTPSRNYGVQFPCPALVFFDMEIQVLDGACEFHGISYAVRGTCSKPAGKAVRQRYSAMQRMYWRPWWEGLKDAERKPPHCSRGEWAIWHGFVSGNSTKKYKKESKGNIAIYTWGNDKRCLPNVTSKICKQQLNIIVYIHVFHCRHGHLTAFTTAASDVQHTLVPFGIGSGE